MKSIIGALLCFVLFVACTPNVKNSPWITLDQWEGLEENEVGEIILSDSGIFTLCRNELVPEVIQNFEFSAEIYTAPGAMAGVWFHTDSAQKGYEILINNTYGEIEKRKTGSLASVRNLYKSLVKNNEWFLLNILVQRKNIIVKINDTIVVNYTEPDKPYRIATHARQLLNEGNFAFTSYDGTVKVKNIQVHKLPVSENICPGIDEQTDEIIRLQQIDYPVIDYHVHLKGWNMQQAQTNAMKVGINYGIAPNCGIGFPVTNNKQVFDFIDSTRYMPFFFGMQGEGREWPITFSTEAMEKFDYVFTDALTFTDHKGRRTRLWIDDEVHIDISRQQYMDMIVQKIVEVIQNEPIDIYVNPCFLPTELANEYNTLWTPERMQKVINALKQKGVALEINARYRIPNAAIIKLARQNGIKLSFGTNNGDPNIGKLDYCIEMIKECGITPKDLYFPDFK